MSITSILIVGVGGQGTLLTSRILGNLALDAGYDVKLSEVHGMAQRGGSVVTHVRFGMNVDSPIIEENGADVILAFEKMEALRWISYLKKGGTVIVNDQSIDPMPVIIGVAKYPDDVLDSIKAISDKTIVVDAIGTAKELGNIRVMNTVLLGAVAKNTEFSTEGFIQAIKNTVPPKTIDVNIKAFEAGMTLS